MPENKPVVLFEVARRNNPRDCFNFMSKYRDLTGQKFGLLTVISRDWNRPSLQKDSKYRIYWKCKCECGKEVSVFSRHLIYRKHTRSCGCLQKNIASKNGKLKKLPEKEGIKRQLFGSYKLRAKKKRMEFDLSRKDFNTIINKPCFYCGRPPSNIQPNRVDNNETLVYNGIDRINSDIGYRIDNVVPCCFVCNRAKSNMPLELFHDWIKRIYEYNFKKQEGKAIQV